MTDPTYAMLAEAARKSPKDYYAAAINATRAIHDSLNAKDRLVARLVGDDLARLKDLLRVSVVLNDCTSVCYDGTSALKVNMPPPHQYRDMFGTEQLRFILSREQMEASGLDLENPQLQPCFLYSDSKAQWPLMNAASTFIESGNVVFQPSRGILSKKAAARSWHVLGVDDKLPLDRWEPAQVPQGAENKPVLIEIEGSTPNAETLFEVTLPFLAKLPMRGLHDMLREEEDLVQSFRAAIRAAVREGTKSSLTAAEIIADVVQPKVAQLERKLRTLRRVHGLKASGAAIGTFTLAFTAASTAGWSAGLLAFASAGGAGVLLNQAADYVAKRDELLLDPYMFLWKVRQLRES